MSEINILYISYDGITDPLGQSQILPYIKGLSGKGANYTVLTFEKKIDLEPAGEILDERISWKRLRYHKRPPVISTCYDIIRGIITGISISTRQKVTIIHARGYVPAAIALFLKRLFGAKFIFDLRGLWAEEKVDSGAWQREGLLYKITKYLEKMFFLKADNIVVLTDNSKRVITESPYAKNKNVDVIPTCADMEQFLPLASVAVKRKLGLKAEFIVLYFGSLGTFYGFKEMVDFFSVVSKYYIDNPFFLIIANNPSGAVDEVIRSGGIAERNYKLTNMPYKALKEVLPIANVSLMFYKRFLSKAGCCPTKFAESLACGLPVVINSGIGDTEEIIKKERVGIVVDQFSEEAYREAAGQLVQLLSEADVLRQRCRAVAERYFSLTKGVEKYWQVYRNLSQV